MTTQTQVSTDSNAAVTDQVADLAGFGAVADEGGAGSAGRRAGEVLMHSGAQKILALPMVVMPEAGMDRVLCPQCLMRVCMAGWAQCYESDCPVVWPSAKKEGGEA